MFMEKPIWTFSVDSGLLSSHLLTSYFSLPNSIAGIFGVFLTLSVGFPLANWQNKPLKEEIKLKESNFKKLVRLINLLFNKIKNLDWVGNKLFLHQCH